MSIEDIFNRLEQSRRRAQSTARKNQDKARESAEFCAADRELVGIEIDIARARNSEQKNELLEKQKNALKKWQEALKKIGFSAEMLEPNFACKKCEDSGYYNGEHCDCVKRLIAESISKESGVINLPNASLDADLNIFPVQQREEMSDLYSYLKAYATRFPNCMYRTTLLLGAAGVGKTYALSALARELINRGTDVTYLTAFAFSQLMLAEHTNFTESRGKKLAALQNVSLLIIDDLGTEPIFKNVTENYLLSIFNERQLAKKHTMFSSNLSIPQLNDFYGTRFISRLNNIQTTQTIILKGKNLRARQ